VFSNKKRVGSVVVCGTTHSQNVPPVHRRFARGTYVTVAKGRKFSSHYRPIVCTVRRLVRLMHGT